ncbi:MAG: DsbE family thiol:disulfide interchange protein [Hyphomicrobiales bacterium]
MNDQANTTSVDASRRGSVGLAVLPLVVFAALATVFYFGLYRGDPSHIPSALIGKPSPEFELAALEDLKADGKPVPGLTSGDLSKGRVTLVNVWASWCGPCRLEHPVLMQLAERGGVDVVGINYKDSAGNARRFLGQLGNPYKAVGVDRSGKAAIDWGVHGVPETFVVDGKGVVVFKYIGPLSEGAVREKLLPAIEQAAAP